MDITDFLSRLDKVKRHGPDKYMALCPAHRENTPSLAVTTTPTGKILLHCFGCGAGAADIVHAMGLKVADLFPTPLDYEPPMAFAQRERRQREQREATLRSARLVVALAESDRRAGKPMTPERRREELQAIRTLMTAGVEYDPSVVLQSVTEEML